jgi:DNA (cytosine-5)-methyltransferase 1
LFCGAGGSSLGARAAGIELRMAANHWQTAIDVHQAHFPDAGHDIADISQADPRRYPRTNILLASPECTNHSQARGVSRKKQNPSLWDAPDPAAERSRATMWDVPRFAEQMRYDAIVTENVLEAAKWVGWRAWHVTMADLG